MRSKFGSEYEDYCVRVKRFWPSSLRREDLRGRFDPEIVKKSEIHTMISTLRSKRVNSAVYHCAILDCLETKEAHNNMNTDGTESGHKGRKKPMTEKPDNVTVNDFLSAISETEYPQYILDAIGQVQEWMKEMTEKPDEPVDENDIFSSIFGQMFGEDDGISGLFERLKRIENFADVIPNTNAPEGKPDTLIISITPPDFDTGIRAAIDYAAVFNRNKCKRVWIISDTFIFEDVIKFVPHVDALAEQGIMLRYILVTPWGWVEMPLSGTTAAKHKFLWHGRQDNTAPEEKPKVRRRRQN